MWGLISLTLRFRFAWKVCVLCGGVGGGGFREQRGRVWDENKRLSETVCAVSSHVCQVENWSPTLHDHPPAPSPSSPSSSSSSSSFAGEGSRMSFIQLSRGIKAKGLLGWKWPQFAPLHTPHLSNIHNPIVLLTAPSPTELHTSCTPHYLIHLTREISHRLWPINSTIYSLRVNAGTY